MRRWWVAIFAVAAVLSLRPQESRSAEPIDNDELVAGPEFQGLPDKSSHSGVYNAQLSKQRTWLFLIAMAMQPSEAQFFCRNWRT